MDFKAIEQLVKVVSESTITSLQIEGEGISIKMGKLGDSQLVNERTVCKEELAKVQLVESTSKEENRDLIETAKKVEGKSIKSPIVGTFYASCSADSDNFVSVGDKVKKGDVLCIVEAMKLMNEIESDFNGEVVAVLVQSGDMVEYGQELFVIKEI